MECHRHSLTLDCLINIFTFLKEEDLIRVSCVCKEWYEAAETPWLWREMCLQRWGFCNVGQLLSGTGGYTWKRYYLHRSSLEHNMNSGRSGTDYTCTTLRGHTGRIVGFSYLASNTALQDIWTRSPVVCSASSDGTVKAWDVHKGEKLWSSSAQNPLTCILTDRQRGVVMTSDSAGTVQTWQGETGALLASFSTGASQCTMLTLSEDADSFLLVGTTLGSLLVLSSPDLSKVSGHVVCDSFRLNVLLTSPDQNCILGASSESSDLSPKVFWCASVCRPVEDEEPLSSVLPVAGCRAAVFLPSQPARVAVIHGGSQINRTSLSVFDLNLKKSRYKQELEAQQIESFQLDLKAPDSGVALQASGNTLLLGDGNELKVYSIKGAVIASFTEHVQPITSLCVDRFRVVTASRDLSLRVLTWRNDRDQGLVLESRYHLLGGSHSMSRGFTGVECDYTSIVASVESVNGRDALKAYVFHS